MGCWDYKEVARLSAWGKVTARSVQGSSESRQKVIHPNIFGGRGCPSTRKLKNSNVEAIVRSRENAQQENCEWLAVLSLEIWALYPEVRICFCPGKFFKSLWGVGQRNENHESVVTIYEWNSLWKFNLILARAEGFTCHSDLCYPSICRRHSLKWHRRSLIFSENSVKTKMTFQR